MRYNNVKMVEHIKRFNPICPVCQKADWELDNALVDVVYHNTNLSQASMKAVCTCTTCGYTLFIDPHIAGAVEED